MAKNSFNRYVWLIDTIQQHGYITLSDISNLWERSVLNEDKTALPERTFFNHRDVIFEIFGIEIKFDKSLGYHIPNSNLNYNDIRTWLLTSLSVNNLINESAELRDRILFENIPSGKQFLVPIINAMKESKVLEMTYQKFQDSEPNTYDVEPYFIKVYKQRWYMIAKPCEGEKLFIYALDRIKCLQQTRMDFEYPKEFNASQYFANWFGIVHDEDYTPQIIRLKVWEKQRDYFRTLPLHATQKEVEVQKKWSIFEYTMAPTWDLEQELLQYNDNVEVLEPMSLRAQMKEHAKNILHLYRHKK